MLTVGRTIKFAQQGPAMVVNCVPFGCMPETVAMAIFGRPSADVDMPIVSLFYGSGGQNRRLEVFLNNAVRGRRGGGGSNKNVDVQVPPSGQDPLVPVQNIFSRMRPDGEA